MCKYSWIFFKANIFGYSFVSYLYWQIYSDIYSSNIYDSKYIWIFIVSQKWLKWLLLVQNGLIWVQNNTKYVIGQNSPKQFVANNLIFEYISKIWKNIFLCKNICWFFLGQIYSDINLWSFYHTQYIWIFLRAIIMVTNIFRYSFIQKKLYSSHTGQ